MEDCYLIVCAQYCKKISLITVSLLSLFLSLQVPSVILTPNRSFETKFITSFFKRISSAANVYNDSGIH